MVERDGGMEGRRDGGAGGKVNEGGKEGRKGWRESLRVASFVAAAALQVLSLLRLSHLRRSAFQTKMPLGPRDAYRARTAIKDLGGLF
eukprot:1047436-Pleurochrysis_carterae.AAC.4